MHCVHNVLHCEIILKLAPQDGWHFCLLIELAERRVVSPFLCDTIGRRNVHHHRVCRGKGDVVRYPRCKGPILFDLVSYCDVRVQSNPFRLKGDKRVLVERAW